MRSGNGKPRRTVPEGATLDVLCIPSRSEADEITGHMLARLLEPRGYRVTVPSASSLTSDRVDLASSSRADAVVVSALPPRAALNLRNVIKRIAARHAGRGVIAGLWNNTRDLAKTGLGDLAAVRVVTTLSEAQDRLDEFAPVTAAATPAGGPLAQMSAP